MNLIDIVGRKTHGEPPDKLPWDDPEFSERMLREHLSQAHDMASRHAETIEAQVAWIDERVLDGPSRVLDLGCGPGLYTQRLAKVGHRCRGIDYSPASIEYAERQVQESGPAIEYVRGDVRDAPYEGPHDLVMMLFGEFNVFSESDARIIAQKARDSLAPGGRLLLEYQTLDSIRSEGQQGPRWYTTESGLFADRSHIVLEEHRWDESARTRHATYYVIDTETALVERYGEKMRAYEEAELKALLLDCGFEDPTTDDTFVPYSDGGPLQAMLATVPL